MPLDRPIPSFYCCYFLRSTVSKTGAYYIGSTPNPVRRLRQHNGLSKGGAVRTSKKGLRPWEMGCIVTGFPSHIATLQFEWAWQNPHISTHIPAESRISIATAKKKSGHAKRPRLTLTSGLSNLHLLLRMPSFARWPLEIRFFNRDVHKAWQKWTAESPAALPESIQIITDFPPKTGVTAVEAPPGPDTKRRKLKGGSVQEPGGPGTKRTKLNYGIDALSVDYTNQKSHVEKAKSIVDFEQEGSCSICNIELEHDGGLYAICPSGDCNSVTHLTCLSTHFLDNDDDIDALVPTDGTCPACKSKIRWIDVVKELTLRMRGQKETEKLLKVKRARKTKEISPSQAADDDSEPSDEELEEQIEAELRELQRLHPELGDSYLNFERDASEESDTGSVASAAPSQAASTNGRSYERSQGKNSLVTVIEDSDWDEAEVLD